MYICDMEWRDQFMSNTRLLLHKQNNISLDHIKLSTSLDWEGNLRSGVTDNSGLSTYRLNGLWKGDEHPAYAPSEYGPPLPF